MTRRIFLCILVTAVLGDEDWGYFYGPSIDPKHWYLEYQQCGGHRQSPINIDLKQTFIDREIKPIRLVNYDETFKNLKMINDGHTIKLEVPVNETNPPIIDHPYFVGFHYYLLQCHFHWNELQKSGSEHTIDGQSFSMEMHCVHQRTNLTEKDRMKEASMLVLSVLFQLSEIDNPDLNSVIDNLQSISNETGEFTTIGSWRFDELLPRKREGFFSYNGSLTTPPCSEIVRWIILSEPVPISSQQMSNKITNYIKSVQPPIEFAHTGPAKTDANNNQLLNLSNGNMAAVDVIARTFQTSWSKDFPWLVRVTENTVKCTVCERNKIDKKNDWVTGKDISTWLKLTFSKHAVSVEHKQNLQIAPMQIQLIATVEKAQTKIESQMIALMTNILAGMQNEISINKIEFLHTLTSHHLEKAKDEAQNSSSSDSKYKYKISTKHRSLFSTYRMLESIGRAVLDSCISKLDHFHNVKHKVRFQLGKVNATILEAVNNDRPLQPSYGRRIRWHPANKASSLRSAYVVIIFSLFCRFTM